MKQVKLISVLLSTLVFLIISSAIVMAKSSELEFRGTVTNIAIPDDGDSIVKVKLITSHSLILKYLSSCWGPQRLSRMATIYLCLN